MGLWTDQEQRNGASYEWLHTTARPATPAPPPPPPEPRKRRWRVRLAAAGARGRPRGADRDRHARADRRRHAGHGARRRPARGLEAARRGRPASTRSTTASSGSVVSIQVQGTGGAGSGSGFVVSSDGTIVTNDHVVENGNQVRVRFDDSRPAGRRPRCSAPTRQQRPRGAQGRPERRERAARAADPRRLRQTVEVGDNAIAIGFPLGLDRTATAGIISGLDRTIQAPNNFTIDNVIQTDAPINPGNSGGPLFDDRGRVIGVNAQIATAGSQGNVGIGFAVPSNTVREVVPRLQRGPGDPARVPRRLHVADEQRHGGRARRPGQSGRPGRQRRPARGQTRLTGGGGDVIVAINGKTRGRTRTTCSSIIADLAPGRPGHGQLPARRPAARRRRSRSTSGPRRPRCSPQSP